MEVETKFKVLNEQFSLQYDRNPIETIKTRLKSPEGIVKKIKRKDLPFSLQSIEENINAVSYTHLSNMVTFCNDWCYYFVIQSNKGVTVYFKLSLIHIFLL